MVKIITLVLFKQRNNLFGVRKEIIPSKNFKKTKKRNEVNIK